MPTARESLLDAAFVALAGRPWPMVRMVDVAAAAGVSRQTLYNEFGSKEGLARALVRRETDLYLRGVDQALSAGSGPWDRLAAVAEWTVRAARGNPLVRALLTGCWSERLPAPRPAPPHSSAIVPAQRRADAGMLSPAELSAAVRDRAAAVLGKGRPEEWRTEEGRDELAHRCELAVRLALSYVIAPSGEDVGRLVRNALRVSAPGVSGPSPRVAVR
ncbi:TetR/AcrR family transcriptional regulator [Streptomyces sp. A3M-1-3]|uniref:TetR/AcrR family transcriptional regulator n=1 Tax=Streptomyces sp. A3M-1-3 TaxID=2962044 RepID=UPI0020B8AF4B|nr:TetR/AcrR family transcriptional regulator [Streptomyces sp. A3M-1-3]MCP3821539.1 TetR/AcrR family transcriptional regulator [Streptomyces sp. A3M-1-3]